MSRAIAEHLCLTMGHKLANFRLTDILDPRSKSVLQAWEVRCTQCGMNPESIEKFRNRKPKRKAASNASS